MTFKVYYQPSKKSNPKRENTHVMYFEAKDEVEARHLVENTLSQNTMLNLLKLWTKLHLNMKNKVLTSNSRSFS